MKKNLQIILSIVAAAFVLGCNSPAAASLIPNNSDTASSETLHRNRSSEPVEIALLNPNEAALTVKASKVWAETSSSSPIISAESEWGNLKGVIIVDDIESLPEIAPEKIDKDVPNCLGNRKAPLDDNLLVAEGGGLKDAFVMMYLKKGEAPAIHPSYEKQLSTPVEIDNKDCRFVPHAAFVRVGQPLRLKNSDDVGHNCHGKLFNNEFNVNVPQNEFVDIKLEAKEKVPGNIVCDIHPWMDSVILVRDEPYVAITDEKGNFEIKNIPAGTWKFQFWHRKSGYMRKLKVPGKEVGRRGEIEVVITGDQTLDLGQLKIGGGEFAKKKRR